MYNVFADKWPIANASSCFLDNQLDEANATRIVECVNACAGIENPGDAMREAREALEIAIGYVERMDALQYFTTPENRLTAPDVIKVKRAAAKLQPQ